MGTTCGRPDSCGTPGSSLLCWQQMRRLSLPEKGPLQPTQPLQDRAGVGAPELHPRGPCPEFLPFLQRPGSALPHQQAHPSWPLPACPRSPPPSPPLQWKPGRVQQRDPRVGARLWWVDTSAGAGGALPGPSHPHLSSAPPHHLGAPMETEQGGPGHVPPWALKQAPRVPSAPETGLEPGRWWTLSPALEVVYTRGACSCSWSGPRARTRWHL